MPPKKKGYHRHHIIPKHMGGDDSPENIEYLTPEEHANAHLKLWEDHGKYEDLMAYNFIVTNWLDRQVIDGYNQSDEHIRKRIDAIDYNIISQKLKGRASPTKGMKLGPPSEETRNKISKATKGKKKDNSRGLMGQWNKGKISKNNRRMCCWGCKKEFSPSRANRHKNCLVK